MKHLKPMLAAAIILFAAAMPSMARAQTPWGNDFQNWLGSHPNAGGQLQQNPYQIYDPAWRAQHPDVQQYLNSNPAAWNEMRSNASMHYGQKMDRFLAAHPDVASKVREDPDLLYSKQFREEHPELQKFMQNHPNVYKKLDARIGPSPEHAMGGPEHGIGAYDQSHQWRDADWWHQHDPGWVNKNHPEWANNHPDWHEAAAVNEGYHPPAHASEVEPAPINQPPPPHHHHHN
jgi:hypothetical protein